MVTVAEANGKLFGIPLVDKVAEPADDSSSAVFVDAVDLLTG